MNVELRKAKKDEHILKRRNVESLANEGPQGPCPLQEHDSNGQVQGVTEKKELFAKAISVFLTHTSN